MFLIARCGAEGKTRSFGCSKEDKKDHSRLQYRLPVYIAWYVWSCFQPPSPASKPSQTYQDSVLTVISRTWWRRKPPGGALPFTCQAKEAVADTYGRELIRPTLIIPLRYIHLNGEIISLKQRLLLVHGSPGICTPQVCRETTRLARSRAYIHSVGAASSLPGLWAPLALRQADAPDLQPINPIKYSSKVEELIKEDKRLLKSLRRRDKVKRLLR
ncbi:hypothetical protein PoB_007082800 [Plakobranchus ocellatus]|uniref:Uncharacterized protein n=1 Tax=Plakobranchus ocellatus TaxID=259542 RepID=A0AAV4DJA9_9GAST|nr:hypothetical protein PoB_007082800 [Plakobranchus ocellatus]